MRRPIQLLEAHAELKVPKRATFVREGAPAPISDQLQGKTVVRVLTTGTHLLIRFTDGTEARLTWRDLSGRSCIGRPSLEEVSKWI